VRAAHQPGDVVELDRLVDDRLRADGRPHAVEALIRHSHHRHVRLDRRERVVRRLCAGACQRVEQRGLARVRHADDADLHGVMKRPTASPISAPATMSEG
jgi:hypothetical protein